MESRSKRQPAQGKGPLEAYRRKRDFGRTPEPEPVVGSSRGGNRYLIQKHMARRLHYDFRLELDGVLLSWAVPNGPSLDPADRRLAVRTEDHPLEYGDFEGVIPAGEYGGGTVMLWDRGYWEPVGDAREGLKKGHLKFRLFGERLRGGWVLTRMKPRPGERDDKEQWLLIKEPDEWARPGQGRLLVDREMKSVASRREMAEIAADRNRVWSSNAGEISPDETKAPGRGRKGADTQGKVISKLIGDAPRRELPDFIAPALATLVRHPPQGSEWLHEIKFDGYRVATRLAEGKVRMLTRKALDWTAKFTPLARLLASLDARTAYVDGEIVVLDESGVTDFAGLQEALSTGNVDRLLYYAFDLLHYDGRDLTSLPLATRKEALKALLTGFETGGRVRYSEHYTDRGPDFFEQACRLALEGVVSKRSDAPYRSGRSRDWLKTKCTHRQEFVVGGWTESTAAGRHLRSILVGYFDNGRFIYAGRIGTGFTAATEAELLAQLKKLERKDPAFVSIPSDARRGVHWTDPKVVIEAEFATWTQDGVIRHASFKGIREDKDPEEVTLEVPLDSSNKKQEGGDRPKAYGGVVLTNPERVLWPDEGITKEALADYYASVAFLMLPHVVNRPLSLVRCPDGIEGECFFQRHMGRGLTSGVRPVKLRDEREPYIAIDDLAGLFSLVQAAALEIHPWGARADDADHPDRMIMDFDPGESVAWSRVVDAALQCRDRLDRLGLISFVKTTGGKGLHVVVPLARRHSWTEVKNFAQALASAMAADDPIYVTTMRKSARQGRIYIDYLRNDFTSSAIAPYSTRARPGAPVAMPLSWDELKGIPSGRHYTLTTVRRRLASLRQDPWQGMEKIAQRLTSKAKRALGLADAS